MTNALVEVENHYFVLSSILLQQVAQKHPDSIADVKRFVARLEDLSVYEKTYYVAELLEALEDKDANERNKEIEKLLKNNKIHQNTISLLQQYNAWIK